MYRFFFNDTATTEIYTLSLHDVFRSFFAERHLGELGPTVMVKNVAVGQEVHVVMAGVALLRAGGLVRPKHVAVAIGDCDDVFAVGCADQNQALCPANDSGEQQREHKEETEIGFHAGEISRLAKPRIS